MYASNRDRFVGRSLFTVAPCFLLACATGFAQDLFSVGGGASLPEDVIFFDQSTGATVGGQFIGLGLPGDNLDAFSNNLSPSIGAGEFAITFSIERNSGTVSSPVTVSAMVPTENAESQRRRDQAGGDQFGSTEAFQLGVGPVSGGPSLGLNNSVLLINQSPWSAGWSGLRHRGLSPAIDEATCNFSIPQPICSANVPVPLFEEDVDGATFGSLAGGTYFSTTATSPSLGVNLPPGNGATIYFDPDSAATKGDERVYATSADLGLGDDDEIDALLVWDANSNGLFDGADHVIYSLATFTPPFPRGADLFVRPYAGPTTTFAEAFVFGLDVDADIDALAAVALGGLPLPDVLANLARMKTVTGDTDGDGDVDVQDLNNVRNNFGVARPKLGDTDGDQDVDIDDLNAVRNHFGAKPGAERMAPEPSGWLLAMILVVAIAVPLARRRASAASESFSAAS